MRMRLRLASLVAALCSAGGVPGGAFGADGSNDALTATPEQAAPAMTATPEQAAPTVAAPAAPDPVPPVPAPPAPAPPVAEPPVAEPPVAEPPVAEPPVSVPPVAEPPVAEPPVSVPPVAVAPVAPVGNVSAPTPTLPTVAQPGVDATGLTTPVSPSVAGEGNILQPVADVVAAGAPVAPDGNTPALPKPAEVLDTVTAPATVTIAPAVDAVAQAARRSLEWRVIPVGGGGSDVPPPVRSLGHGDAAAVGPRGPRGTEPLADGAGAAAATAGDLAVVPAAVGDAPAPASAPAPVAARSAPVSAVEPSRGARGRHVESEQIAPTAADPIPLPALSTRAHGDSRGAAAPEQAVLGALPAPRGGMANNDTRFASSGAGGAAVVAAVLAAFLLVAPILGRWLRPGRLVVRPPMLVGLLERPG